MSKIIQPKQRIIIEIDHMRNPPLMTWRAEPEQIEYPVLVAIFSTVLLQATEQVIQKNIPVNSLANSPARS